MILKKMKTMLGLGKHCLSLRSATPTDPTPGEVKTAEELGKGLRCRKVFSARVPSTGQNSKLCVSGNKKRVIILCHDV